MRYSKKQSSNGGKKTQELRKQYKMEMLKKKHGGLANLEYCGNEYNDYYLGMQRILTGVHKDRVFLSEEKPDAIFNDGTILGGNENNFVE